MNHQIHTKQGHLHHATHQTHTDEEHQLFLKAEKVSDFKLAVSATLHCLVGCGIGEVLGMILGAYFGWGMIDTMIVAITLGFVFGFLLGMIPLLRKKFSIKDAFKIVFAAELMEAGLSDSIFWIGMLAALAVGFIAAFPVNYYMIRRGVRHQH